MNLSEKIRYLRIQKGMTQAELAEKLNTTKQTIGKYENQVVTNLPLNRIQELADALDTTPAYLMGWGEEKPAEGELSLPSDLSEDKLWIINKILSCDEKELNRIKKIYAAMTEE